MTESKLMEQFEIQHKELLMLREENLKLKERLQEPIKEENDIVANVNHYIVNAKHDKAIDALNDFMEKEPLIDDRIKFLSNAIMNGNLDLVKVLIEKNFPIYYKVNKEYDQNGECYADKHYYALYEAASYGDLKIVMYLVETCGPAAMYSKNKDETVLQVAINNYQLEVVKYLIKQGAIGDDIDKLMDSIKNFKKYNIHKQQIDLYDKMYNTLKFLIERSTKKYMLYIPNLLQWTVETNHIELLKILVEAGADIRANNQCALQTAIDMKHTDIIKYIRSLM